MYELPPRMVQHLESRYTRLGELAAALHMTIAETGLRLPARRQLARWARLSEATVGRRMQEVCTEERLVSALVRARTRTYPPGWASEGWGRWLPATARDLTDVRVWIACLELGAASSAAASAVCAAWASELRGLEAQLMGTIAPEAVDDDVRDDAEVLQAYVLGTSIRRALDPAFTPERAADLLGRLIAALDRSPSAAE
ncbi:hypothetical protein GCM10011376_00820 [Nocardioides flavus (ex Wang et al. 2016)]|uniref:BetI-type transcriptional repressor C-terminal domain-containing protein n=1 Tax=Nocardioides flavus (ex Wang et al. 2016) TaxID=2058780 RepID=A0ABQ3HFN5_9ACTN|nr:TetR family transcriptional regulator C-terminal domain-containing protein [Nocardioides flavus (ex Wang et al. 2016)]GHE14938.1 hypothetical protein GCM10011376_00820 [Nocardioides flavus (ex Wang et al. 2016)]